LFAFLCYRGKEGFESERKGVSYPHLPNDGRIIQRPAHKWKMIKYLE